MPDLANCPRCNSTRIVQKARLVDRGRYSGDAGNLQAGVERRPDAWIRKDLVATDIDMRFCGDCGYVELYIEAHEQLYKAYQERLGHDA